MDVLHTAIWVSDLEETTAFYCDGLGLEHTRDFVGDDGVTNYFVGGESDAEIQFKHDDADREVEPSGIDHLAVATDDVEETVETVVEDHDSEAVKGPLTMEDMNVAVAFVTDPDGYVVELIQDLDA